MPPAVRLLLRCVLCAVAIVALGAAGDYALALNPTSAALCLLLVVLAAAAGWGFFESIVASLAGVLTLNYFFVPPVRTFSVAAPENWFALFTFLITALTASRLSANAKQRSEEAMSRRADIARLYELSRALMMGEDSDSIRQAVSLTGQVFGIPTIAFYDRNAQRLYGSTDRSAFTQGDLERVATNGELLELSGASVIPVRLGSHIVGSLGVVSADLSPEVRDSVASLLAIHYERTMALRKASVAEAARRGEEFRTSLLDAFAHDLKTPLSAIRTCITRLISIPPRTEDVRRELLQIIDEESERLRISITGAIELARAESGALDPEMSEVPLENILPPGENGLTIDAPDGLCVRADPALLRRALGQVIENARKYSPSGGIVVEARKDEHCATISILDRGPGIACEDRERIFEKFSRGADWPGKAAGTGMGLHIAKAIIEAHGGTIRAEGRDGGGSAFVISIPSSPA